MTEKTITVLPKKERLQTDIKTGAKIKKRVCAYARVSTDLTDQKNSFRAQLEEYQNRIKRNPDWEFTRLYSDEGISGTSIKNRKGFAEMIGDALNGKIDLILTKSISRFARNTVDCLQTVRDLREKNVEVFFDKENISTTDPKIEMMLTIFASMAQEESKSISENVKWGVRKRMAKGQRKIQAKTLLGYDNAEDGSLVINEQEAEIVREIFNLYIAGSSMREIEDYLKKGGFKCKSPTGQWSIGYISRILGNEKYIGDVLLQKTVVVDFLSHKAVKNDGIEESYYIENHHPAIIDKKAFEYVQAIKAGKVQYRNMYENTNRDMLSGIVFCESCLRKMTKVSQHSGTPYCRFVYTCKNIDQNDPNYIKCNMPNTTDYKCLKKVVSDIFTKYYQPPLNMVDILDNEFNRARKTSNNYAQLNVVKNEIRDLKKDMDELVKKQVENLEDSTIEREFLIKKELLMKKNLEKENLEASFKNCLISQQKQDAIKTFLAERYISPILVSDVVKKVLIRSNGSALIILSKTEFTLTRQLVNELLAIQPIENGRVDVDGRSLNYEVINYEGVSL